VRAMGLVHRVIPQAELTAAALAYAQKLMAKPFGAMAQVKANVNASVRSGITPVMVEPASLLTTD
jgi:enoyl-CoA hydratase/carnithine racemase